MKFPFLFASRRLFFTTVSQKRLAVLGVVAGTLGCALFSRAATPQPAFFGVAYGNQTICLGGSWQQGKGWQKDEVAMKQVKPGTSFGVYQWNGKLIGKLTAKVANPADAGAGVYVTPSNSLPLSGDDTTGRLTLANIAKPFVRFPRAQSLKNPLYETAIANLLKAKGLKLSRVNLIQHWRVDLNGDGREEVLLAAQSSPKVGTIVNTEKGDYAVLALRFVDSRTGKLKLQPIEIQAQPAAKSNELSLGFSFLGCPDINGDGKLEIVTDHRYYEGGGVSVWSFDGQKVQKSAEAGWGV